MSTELQRADQETDITTLSDEKLAKRASVAKGIINRQNTKDETKAKYQALLDAIEAEQAKRANDNNPDPAPAPAPAPAPNPAPAQKPLLFNQPWSAKDIEGKTAEELQDTSELINNSILWTKTAIEDENTGQAEKENKQAELKILEENKELIQNRIEELKTPTNDVQPPFAMPNEPGLEWRKANVERQRLKLAAAIEAQEKASLNNIDLQADKEIFSVHVDTLKQSKEFIDKHDAKIKELEDEIEAKRKEVDDEKDKYQALKDEIEKLKQEGQQGTEDYLAKREELLGYENNINALKLLETTNQSSIKDRQGRINDILTSAEDTAEQAQDILDKHSIDATVLDSNGNINENGIADAFAAFDEKITSIQQNAELAKENILKAKRDVFAAKHFLRKLTGVDWKGVATHAAIGAAVGIPVKLGVGALLATCSAPILGFAAAGAAAGLASSSAISLYRNYERNLSFIENIKQTFAGNNPVDAWKKGGIAAVTGGLVGAFLPCSLDALFSDGSTATLTPGVVDGAPEAPIAEGTPAEETPAEETPAEETPAEATPAEETPAEETPAEATPVEATPVEATPAEETPAEEAVVPPVTALTSADIATDLDKLLNVASGDETEVITNLLALGERHGVNAELLQSIQAKVDAGFDFIDSAGAARVVTAHNVGLEFALSEASLGGTDVTPEEYGQVLTSTLERLDQAQFITDVPGPQDTVLNGTERANIRETNLALVARMN
jgi:cell division septation protein DedD